VKQASATNQRRRVTSTLIAALGCAPLIGSLILAQAPAGDSKFPDAPGKAVFLKMCSDCHGPESAIAQFKTRDEWSKTLDDMASNGAQGTDEEWNQVLDYLDKYFSLILINKATAKQLAGALDVPMETAEGVVKYRAEHGRFGSIDDLKNLPGLDAAKLQTQKDRFVF
jgi:competence protein ComEA